MAKNNNTENQVKKDGILKKNVKGMAKYVGYDALKEPVSMSRKAWNIIFNKNHEVINETFEEAQKRLDFNVDTLKSNYTTFQRTFFVMLGILFIDLSASAYQLMSGKYIAFVSCLVIGYIIGLLTIQNSLRCYQIKYKKMIGYKELFDNPFEILPTGLEDNYTIEKGINNEK